MTDIFFLRSLFCYSSLSFLLARFFSLSNLWMVLSSYASSSSSVSTSTCVAFALFSAF